MARPVHLTIAEAFTMASPQPAETGAKPMAMNFREALAEVTAKVTPTTIKRLAPDVARAATARPLALAAKIAMGLDCGIDDRLEAVRG